MELLTRHALVTRLLACLVLSSLCTGVATAQTLPIAGDPGRNVNLIGPTPDPGDIRDTGLKQQNEPACAVRPENPACVICLYNDYRTVEVPVDAFGTPIIGDAWQGASMSCDVGTGDTWTSRIAPGHAAHPNPTDARFAADPRAVALPGMVVSSFIAGFRDSNAGFAGIHHWLETNREDLDYYEPAAATTIADFGTEGQFNDKGELLALLDPPNRQGTISLSFDMENPALGTITREFPTGDLLVAFSVFTGSNSVKILVKSSPDWGQTWSNKSVKLSEEQNQVSGISMTAIGDTVLAAWRRVSDNNDPDSIVWAVSNNRGRSWTKGEAIDICRFDQVSFASGDFVTFRTNDFPWVANDGKRFYLFYADRNFDGQAYCTGGRPRIVMQHTAPGNISWSAPAALDDSLDAGEGMQFMPTAFGARGKVQVAWYDTRRELLPPLGTADPVFRDQLVADYVELDRTSRTAVNRKVDVYTARVISDAAGGNVQVSPATRVTQFRIAAEAESGAIDGPLLEAEASFANAKLYDSGQLSFLGDYTAMAAPEFRRRPDGKWESNASPVIDPITDSVDFFTAWTSQRDIRGEILPEALDVPVPYEPAGSGMAVTQSDTQPAGSAADPARHAEGPRRLAGLHSPADPPRSRSGTTEGLEGTEQFVGTCVPGADPQDRTRDSNIYGSLIRDQLRLYAPTPTKPLSGLQRTFPVGLTNRDGTPQTFRLLIANQPCGDPLTCRASWLQQPSGPLFDPADPPPQTTTDLTVPANSTLARTLFMVGAGESDQVTVQVLDAACADGPGPCPVLASLVLGGTATGTAGELQQPVYDDSPICADDPDPQACFSNLENELHNPELVNPELVNPELVNPELVNPELVNPELVNPELVNAELLNPELVNLGFANPELVNPELVNQALLNPELVNPELVNPELVNPELVNPELVNSTLGDGTTWVDYTFPITNTGNVTTALNADLALSGPDADKVDSQLIASTLHIVPTSRDCQYLPQFETQVLATVNSPDDDLDVASIEDPFNGGISALAAPGQTIFFTRRIFGTPEELANVTVSGFTASSQAANCSETNLDGTPEDDYVCQQSLVDDQELIVLDTAPPVFSGVADGDIFAFEAQGPDGACADLVGSGAIQATDNGEPVPVVCTADGVPICDSGDPDGSPFQVPLNTPTDVTCSATDAAGNSASVDVVLMVTDLSAPFFTSFPVVPISLDADPVSGTASLDFEAQVIAEDVNGVDPNPGVFCRTDTGVVTGGVLSPGGYTVTCSATDASGNTDAANDVSYNVSVQDVTPPVITLTGVNPQDIEAGDGYVELGATASDSVDGDVTASIVIDATAVDTSAVGSYVVTYNVSDAAGNLAAEVTRTVNVVDTMPPVITLIGANPQTIEGGTPYVELGATASDIADGDLSASIVIDASAVDTASVGSYPVTYDVTDASGNVAATVSRTVNVVDTSGPVISLLGDDPQTVEAGQPYVEQGALANDTVDGNLSASIVIDATAVDTSVPGSYLVFYNVSDASGNAAPEVTRTVNVVDTGAPLFEGLPLPDVTVPAADVNGTVVDYVLPTATDAGDPSPDVSCAPASGSLFPIGTTLVTCTATDASGNAATATFNVIVQDNVAPVITVPDGITAVVDGAAGATVDYSGEVSVTDNADPSPSLSCSPASGSVFPIGTTTVTCLATDVSGNSASESFILTVQYGEAVGIFFSGGLINAGSTVPLTFAWKNAFGNLADSSAADPLVTAFDCATGQIVLDPGQFPGNSDRRYDASKRQWRFNWQTVFEDGTPLPATRQGTDYCVQATSSLTGQNVPETGTTVITLKGRKN